MLNRAALPAGVFPNRNAGPGHPIIGGAATPAAGPRDVFSGPVPGGPASHPWVTGPVGQALRVSPLLATGCTAGHPVVIGFTAALVVGLLFYFFVPSDDDGSTMFQTHLAYRRWERARREFEGHVQGTSGGSATSFQTVVTRALDKDQRATEAVALLAAEKPDLLTSISPDLARRIAERLLETWLASSVGRSNYRTDPDNDIGRSKYYAMLIQGMVALTPRLASKDQVAFALEVGVAKRKKRGYDIAPGAGILVDVIKAMSSEARVRLRDRLWSDIGSTPSPESAKEKFPTRQAALWDLVDLFPYLESGVREETLTRVEGLLDDETLVLREEAKADTPAKVIDPVPEVLANLASSLDAGQRLALSDSLIGRLRARFGTPASHRCFSALTRFGHALWTDPAVSRRIIQEMVRWVEEGEPTGLRVLSQLTHPHLTPSEAWILAAALVQQAQTPGHDDLPYEYLMNLVLSDYTMKRETFLTEAARHSNPLLVRLAAYLGEGLPFRPALWRTYLRSSTPAEVADLVALVGATRT